MVGVVMPPGCPVNVAGLPRGRYRSVYIAWLPATPRERARCGSIETCVLSGCSLASRAGITCRWRGRSSCSGGPFLLAELPGAEHSRAGPIKGEDTMTAVENADVGRNARQLARSEECCWFEVVLRFRPFTHVVRCRNGYANTPYVPEVDDTFNGNKWRRREDGVER